LTITRITFLCIVFCGRRHARHAAGSGTIFTPMETYFE
jgi:hypothetical protein